jgi:ParB family transcriptional regulator, chromosome partitioning protein
MMFNIHMLREQWDYFTIANKLPKVISLYKAENRGEEPTEQKLSELTGLTRGQIRRCRYLQRLPDRYKKLLIDELDLPKPKQRLSEDFFIEMERALNTIQLRIPESLPDINRTRDVLIRKYRDRVIDNVTDFRKLSKMATAVDTLGMSRQTAKAAFRAIFTADNSVDISATYTERFEFQYDVRKVTLHGNSLIEFLRGVKASGAKIDDDLRKVLLKIRKLIGEIVD